MNPKRVTNIGIKYRLCHFASKFNKAFTPMYKNIYPDTNNRFPRIIDKLSGIIFLELVNACPIKKNTENNVKYFGYFSSGYLYQKKELLIVKIIKVKNELIINNFISNIYFIPKVTFFSNFYFTYLLQKT